MITSIRNPGIREIIALNSKHKERLKTRLFAAEGINLFLEAPKSLIRKVYVSDSFEKKNKDLISGTKHEVVEDSLFQRISDTKSPQGIITILSQPVYAFDDLLKGNVFIVVLEDLRDPGNVGTIMRSAEGAGATGMILSKGCADLFSPKTIRSTMGSIFRVPFIYSENLEETAAWMRRKNVRVYGAHLRGDVFYDEPSYSGKTAIVIGNESSGLSEELSACCDKLIYIPMEGKLESLNAAAAATVLMFAAGRKRKKKRETI